MIEFPYILLNELKRGDTVVVVDGGNTPRQVVIKTIGRKYITTTECNSQIYFDRDTETKYSIRGGNKDGSYQVFVLWKVPTLFDYINLTAELQYKTESSDLIKGLLNKYKNDISVKDYEIIRNILLNYGSND